MENKEIKVINVMKDGTIRDLTGYEIPLTERTQAAYTIVYNYMADKLGVPHDVITYKEYKQSK